MSTKHPRPIGPRVGSSGGHSGYRWVNGKLLGPDGSEPKEMTRTELDVLRDVLEEAMNIEQRLRLANPLYGTEKQAREALRATLDDLERAEARVVALQAVGSTLCGVAWGAGLFYATDPWRKLTSQLDPTAERLLVRLRAAEAVCEAAASVITEGVRQELSAYVMGVELITRVEAWRHSKEMK